MPKLDRILDIRTGFGLPILESAEPLSERLGAIWSPVAANLDHYGMVTYTSHLGKGDGYRCWPRVCRIRLALRVRAFGKDLWASGRRALPSFVRTSLKPVTYLGLVESILLLGGSLVAGPLLVLAAAALGEADWQGAPLAPEPVVALLETTIVIGFFALSLVAGHRLSLRLHADRRTASRALIPFAVLALAFTVAGLVLLAQPMGMRHGM